MQVALVRKFGSVRFSAEWKLEGDWIWGGCVNVYMCERSYMLDTYRKSNKDMSSAHLGFSFNKGQEVQRRPEPEFLNF
jgi:hypothetical protein